MNYTVLTRIGWRRQPDAWIGDCFMYHVPKDTIPQRQYVAGIGDAWSVKVADEWNRQGCTNEHDLAALPLIYGNSYNYGAPGFDQPRYPVPSVLGVCKLDAYLGLVGCFSPDWEYIHCYWDSAWND